MQRSMAGDGTTDHPLRRVRIEHFGIWVLPRFLENPRHVSATIFDFRRKLVLLACTMSLRQDVFVTRALAYVGLLMTALNGGDRWTWSDWRYIDLMGPRDPTHNSCAVSVLLVAQLLSRGVGVPIAWTARDMNTARDVFSLHLLSGVPLAPRWEGLDHAVLERWTLRDCTRIEMENGLLRAVLASCLQEQGAVSKLLSEEEVHGFVLTTFGQLMSHPSFKSGGDRLEQLTATFLAGHAAWGRRVVSMALNLFTCPEFGRNRAEDLQQSLDQPVVLIRGEYVPSTVPSGRKALLATTPGREHVHPSAHPPDLSQHELGAYQTFPDLPSLPFALMFMCATPPSRWRTSAHGRRGTQGRGGRHDGRRGRRGEQGRRGQRGRWRRRRWCRECKR